MDMYRSYRFTDCWDVLQSPPRGTDLHVVMAERSDRWDKAATAQLDKAVQENGGRTKAHTLEGAGHWLHVDNPTGLAALMVPPLAALD